MYGFHVRLGMPFSEALVRVVEALKAEGFGVLTEIDVQATLKAKLGLERRPYMILGACNPAFAARALDAEPDIGLLLPCNVVVREEAHGEVLVGFMDPAVVLGLVEHDELRTLGAQVREMLMRVRNTLATSGVAA